MPKPLLGIWVDSFIPKCTFIYLFKDFIWDRAGERKRAQGGERQREKQTRAEQGAQWTQNSVEGRGLMTPKMRFHLKINFELPGKA